MDDSEALLLLGAGSNEDRGAASDHLFSAYFAPLVSLLQKIIPDADAARSGAGQAFIVSFRQACVNSSRPIDSVAGPTTLTIEEATHDDRTDGERGGGRV